MKVYVANQIQFLTSQQIVPGTTFLKPIELRWADGAVGCMPVFESEAAARAFAPAAEIIELEMPS